MNLLLVGMNHRTAPLEVRERFAAAEPKPLLTKLVAHPEIEEAVLISTCNRVEVVALSRQPDAARHVIGGFFHRELGHGEALPRGLHLASLLYEHLDGAAVRHLFRVASSIDSLVVGEPQILGQVKDAYRAAVEVGSCGPVLGRLFQRAFGAAKRVRTETQMGERPVSVARVAVDLACQIFDTLSDKTALLVGAGDMIEIALEALRSEGLTSVLVANRTVRHAEALAGRFDASAHGLTELPSLLARSDVVLSCIGGAEPVLDVPTVSAALRARGNRPIFLIDIGVPRNVAPDVNRLDNVYLYDQDDLAGVAEANAEERRRETQRAEAIVLEEQQRFDGWLAALEAVPTIVRLRERAESIRAAEVARALRRLPLDPGARDAVEALSRALVNKILHAPISRLREDVDRAQGLAHLEAARSLFGLDEGDPVEPEPAPDGESGPDDDPDLR